MAQMMQITQSLDALFRRAVAALLEGAAKRLSLVGRGQGDGKDLGICCLEIKTIDAAGESIPTSYFFSAETLL